MSAGKWRAIGIALAVTLAAVSSAQGDERWLPQVQALMSRADAAAVAGRTQEAMACSDLVLWERPRTIFLDSSRLGFAEALKAREAVERAIQLWERNLDGAPAFSLTNDRTAEITIRYSERVTLYGEDVAGHATWQRDVANWGRDGFLPQFSANVRLRTTDLRGGALSLEAMTQTAAHELGHLLGLRDSPRSDDVMGPLNVNRPVSEPSVGELNSLSRLRLQALAFRADALASHLLPG